MCRYNIPLYPLRQHSGCDHTREQRAIITVAMTLNEIGRALIILGVLILVVGLALMLGPRIPLLGRLPGDISIHKGNTHVYIPLATGVLLSLILTVIANVVLRLFR